MQDADFNTQACPSGHVGQVVGSEHPWTQSFRANILEPGK